MSSSTRMWKWWSSSQFLHLCLGLGRSIGQPCHPSHWRDSLPKPFAWLFRTSNRWQRKYGSDITLFNMLRIPEEHYPPWSAVLRLMEHILFMERPPSLIQRLHTSHEELTLSLWTGWRTYMSPNCNAPTWQRSDDCFAGCHTEQPDRSIKAGL